MIAKMSHYAIFIILSICASVIPESFADESKKDNLMTEESIDRHFENSKSICQKKKDDLRDICMTEAEGVRDIARAKLKAKIDPKLENEVDYRINVAEAKYSLNVEKCQKSYTKSSCIDKAKVLRDKEIEDARAGRD